jgi:type IV secretory pathway VirB6-like protein
MKRILGFFCLLVLLLGMSGLAAAQDTTTPSDQSAKSDMKQAGHSTKKAAKKTGSAVKKTSKKVTHKAAKKTRQGSQKVEDKTAPPQ